MTDPGKPTHIPKLFLRGILLLPLLFACGDGGGNPDPDPDPPKADSIARTRRPSRLTPSAIRFGLQPRFWISTGT